MWNMAIVSLHCPHKFHRSHNQFIYIALVHNKVCSKQLIATFFKKPAQYYVKSQGSPLTITRDKEKIHNHALDKSLIKTTFTEEYNPRVNELHILQANHTKS